MAQEVALCILIVIILIRVTLQSLQDDIATRINGTEKSLSRKRRYLVFPEGSSLQLVYCLTVPSVGVGQIFTIGSTAALAWELPHDPYQPFRPNSELLHRIDKPGEETSGGWTLENGNSPAPVSNMKTYYNPFFINKPPSVGYSTINELSSNPYNSAVKAGFASGSWRKSNYYYASPRIQTGIRKDHRYTHDPHKMAYGSRRTYNRPVTAYVHPVYHKVYRRTRRDLYTKIEKLLTALSRDGRACLLKSVCEVSKATRERGTFMEEIIKAIFRVRHHEDDSGEEHDVFDMAANQQHNCTEMYPECEHSIWGGMFS